MAMFKHLCCIAIPLFVTSSFSLAQNNSPNAKNEVAPEKVAQMSVSAGSIKTGDHLIVPGQRIGPIALNATRKQVEAILGAPATTIKMEENSDYSTWRWAKQPKEAGRADFFEIIFQKERVVQIETNASAFALPNGLSIQSPAADWSRLWGSKPERRTVMMSIVGTPMHLTWKVVGFAMKVPWESKTPGDVPIQSVIVLPKNQLATTTFSLLRSLRAPDPTMVPMSQNAPTVNPPR